MRLILHLQVVAKQSENRFLGEQTEKARILVKKIQEKEVHRDKLSQENQKNSKELEAVTKIKAANQRRNNEIRKQICKGQENIQDMQVTHCHDDILQIFHMRNQSLELHLHFLRLNAILSLSLLISKLSTLEN